MDSLSKNIYSVVSSAVDEFIDLLVAEFDLDKEKVVNVWNTKASAELAVVSGKSIVKRAPRKKAESVSGDKKTCIYTYVKGAKEGELCNAKVIDDSESGSYCKKHIAHENAKEVKKTKKAPVKAPVRGKKAEAVEEKKNVISALKATTPTVSIKMNARRRYYHSDTGLIFDRNTREVYGREDDEGELIPLKASDIELCKQYGFKYRLPENLTNDVDGDGGSDEAEGKDDGEEEEEEVSEEEELSDEE